MTLTPFALGARVQIQPWIRSPNIEGKLVKIGRKYITVMLDSGEIINRLHPTSIIRPLRSSPDPPSNGPVSQIPALS